jgi:signal transduction histidine kinase
VIYSSDPGFGQQQVADADGTMDIFGRTRNNAGGSPIEVFHKTSQNRGTATAAGVSWFPLLRETAENDDWQLIVRHRRGGPLGAFVADMHRRDLAISFGALLLLVVSMAMLIITSNRAQRLARLQMDFVTAVSHELRTPLTIIDSAADNITQGVVEGKEQLMQYGSVIGNQVTQLSGLVEQILLFAATNEGRQRFSLQPLEVGEIVDATLASTAGLIRAAHFTVEREIEPNLPQVRGDLLALSQSLQNLITNALKYGREQRWIGIRARAVEYGAAGKEIQISVSDRGIGIAAHDLPHIFEPFYRSPSVAAAQIHGTGLGLALARRIVEAMRGQLTVASEPGRGSTFTLHLPCAEQVTASAESPSQAPSPSPTLHRG